MRTDYIQAVKISANPWLGFSSASRRLKKLQFEVKGQEYFLAFVEDERRWYLFSPTPQGVQRIPVYVDGPVFLPLHHGEPQRKTSS
jgi:hypothetical protein